MANKASGGRYEVVYGYRVTGRSSLVVGALMASLLLLSFAPATSAEANAPSLVAQGATNLGFCGGDDWEPEIAADHLGHVYAVIAHFEGDPTCNPASARPNQIYFRASSDGGATFGPRTAIPRAGYPRVVDNVVTVDEVTGAVYVSFLAYGRSDMKAKDTDVVVAKSTDFGKTWTTTKISGPLCTECDHPWILANDNNVYVTYASGKNHFLSRSSDGGRTWHESLVLQDTHVAFPEGGVLDRNENPWFAWGDCFGSCTGKNAAIYQASRTTAGTSHTTFVRIAKGAAGPHCPPSVTCGFAYWGPQDDIAMDAAGNLYLVWQDSNDNKPGRPTVVQLSKCQAGTNCKRSANWRHVGRVDDKRATGCAGGQCYALYPRIEGGGPGEISTIWMDDRMGHPIDHHNGWNVWLRSSTNGGTSWTGPSKRVSSYDPKRPESHPNGFDFPYGDYQGIDLTPDGKAVMVWGEGQNYVGGPSSPGHVIYRSMTP